MELNQYFKSIIDLDDQAIVICDKDRNILYINKAAEERYKAKGGASLAGRSLDNCHKPETSEKHKQILAWFEKDPKNNRVFITHKEKTNEDTYFTAIRSEDGQLIGYYEKHCVRTPQPLEELFKMD